MPHSHNVAKFVHQYDHLVIESPIAPNANAHRLIDINRRRFVVGLANPSAKWSRDDRDTIRPLNKD